MRFSDELMSEVAKNIFMLKVATDAKGGLDSKESQEILSQYLNKGGCCDISHAKENNEWLSGILMEGVNEN